MTTATPIDLEVFRNAVQEWLSTATGLEAIWRDQSAPEPPYPFASLLITSGPVAVAPGWEIRQSFDAGRPAGEEYKTDAVVPCRFVVSCQAYVAKNAAADPNNNAVGFMSRAMASLNLPSVRAILYASNIAVETFGGVVNIDEVIEDAFVSRANFDVTFGASLSATEYNGYVNKVEVKSTELNVDMLIDAS